MFSGKKCECVGKSIGPLAEKHDTNLPNLELKIKSTKPYMKSFKNQDTSQEIAFVVKSEKQLDFFAELDLLMAQS